LGTFDKDFFVELGISIDQYFGKIPGKKGGAIVPDDNIT
jgi:hypothetical protein